MNVFNTICIFNCIFNFDLYTYKLRYNFNLSSSPLNNYSHWRTTLETEMAIDNENSRIVCHWWNCSTGKIRRFANSRTKYTFYVLNFILKSLLFIFTSKINIRWFIYKLCYNYDICNNYSHYLCTWLWKVFCGISKYVLLKNKYTYNCCFQTNFYFNIIIINNTVYTIYSIYLNNL